MNILLIVRFFAPGVGGAAFVFNLISQMLADDGHNVFVLTNKLRNVNYPKHEKIKIIFVSPPREYEGGKRIKIKDFVQDNWNAIKIGLSLIKKEKIDIIHSNSPYFPIAGAILSFLKSTPHILTMHEVVSTHEQYFQQWSKQKGNTMWDKFFGPFLEKIIVKLHSSVIHTVSEATKDDLLKIGAKKPIYVIHNALPFIETKNVPIEPLQILYLGRLVFYKNIEVVIKSIKILRETFPKIKFLVVGDGPYKENLVKLVSQLNLQENVVFKGYVSEDEKNLLLSSSQALVFPSLCEGFGMVILEAFAQKKPAIVSQVRPMSDIVENKKNGLVVPPNNENEWAKAIESILTDPDSTKQMGIFGRQQLDEKYNLEIMLKKILKMYNEVVRHR